MGEPGLKHGTQPALVAQLVEQVTLNHRVQGSSPCGGIKSLSSDSLIKPNLPTWKSAVSKLVIFGRLPKVTLEIGFKHAFEGA